MQPPLIQQPARPDSNRSWLIVLAILGLGVCLCGGSIIGGSLWVYSQAKEDPKPMEGYGKGKLLKKLENGWAQYRLDDIGVQIELPGPPLPYQEEFQPGEALYTKSWATYEANGGYLNVFLSAYEDGLASGNLRDHARSDLDFYRSSKDYEGLQSSQRNIEIDGRAALRLDMSYKRQSYRIAGRNLYWRVGRKISIVRVEWLTSEPQGRKGADRLQTSIAINSQ